MRIQECKIEKKNKQQKYKGKVEKLTNKLIVEIMHQKGNINKLLKVSQLKHCNFIEKRKYKMRNIVKMKNERQGMMRN